MQYDRPVVMSVAGFDPSGGAGLLADMKTLEQQCCLGFGVVSAWTVQTEDRFLDLQWLAPEQLKAQAAPLLEQYQVQALKVGMMPSLEQTANFLVWLKTRQSPRIVWDPVLSATAGQRFVSVPEPSILAGILPMVSLLTPNAEEAVLLTGAATPYAAAGWLAKYTAVLLKGGHLQSGTGTDLLWLQGMEAPIPLPLQEWGSAKHGSGCILSAAVAAGLAQGKELPDACRAAKAYMAACSMSTNHLLAYHHA